MSRLEKLLGPVGLSGLVRGPAYRAIRDPEWTFGQAGIRSRNALRQLRNSQKGAEGFIVGTGPSLNNTALDKIDNRPSIGLNRLFLGFQHFGFVPDFLVCVNLLMIEQSGAAISQLPCTRIASWEGRRHLGQNVDTIYLRTTDSIAFSQRLMDTVSTGATVTYVAIQLAHWLGWRRVVLLGVDHNYDLEHHEAGSSPHQKVTRTQADRNHFHEDYMPAGKSWQLPDLVQSEMAYREARRAFEAEGREIVDATVGGKLRVFPRCEENFARPKATVKTGQLGSG